MTIAFGFFLLGRIQFLMAMALLHTYKKDGVSLKEKRQQVHYIAE